MPQGRISGFAGSQNRLEMSVNIENERQILKN
jgi:hypothetical protein